MDGSATEFDRTCSACSNQILFISSPNANMSTQSIITLNVGGTEFTTSRSTLEMYEGFFKALCSRSNETSFFVDRDPMHFRHILNYMRGSPTFPTSKTALRELKSEADFYCFDMLAQHIAQIEISGKHDSVTHHLEIIAAKMN